MVRFKLATFLMTLPVTGLAAPQVATDGLAPGRYQGPGYVTRFEGNGQWSSTANGATQPAVAGRYSVDGDVLFFTSGTNTCSVRYRMTPTTNGFRIHLLDDGCTHVAQMPDIEFVRVR